MLTRVPRTIPCSCSASYFEIEMTTLGASRNAPDHLVDWPDARLSERCCGRQSYLNVRHAMRGHHAVRAASCGDLADPPDLLSVYDIGLERRNELARLAHVED